MFRVKNICVIIAFFLSIATSTGLGKDVEVDASGSTVVIDERTGAITVGEKAVVEDVPNEASEDALFKHSPETNSDNTKDKLQMDLVKRFTLAIGFVALLGYGTFYFSKKIVPKLTASKGKSISIIDSVSLGQNKTLHIVEIENKKLLIGCTANSINTLSELSGTFREILQTCQDNENEL